MDSKQLKKVGDKNPSLPAASLKSSLYFRKGYSMNAPYESTLSKVKNLPTKYYNNVFGFNYNQMIRPRSNNFKLYAIPKRFEGAIMNGTESDYILDGDLDLKIAENDSEYMEKQFKIDVGSFGSPDDELLKTK